MAIELLASLIASHSLFFCFPSYPSIVFLGFLVARMASERRSEITQFVSDMFSVT